MAAEESLDGEALEMAFNVAHGLGIPRDLAAAEGMYRDLAARGSDAAAAVCLARGWTEEGEARPRDALATLEGLAEGGDAWAGTELGAQLAAMAAGAWERAASAGQGRDGVVASFLLARCLDGGIGAPRNPVRAADLYAISAAGGYLPAEAVVEGCAGGGVDGAAESVAAYLEAAERGVVDAQFNLAVCFERGEGVARDPRKAVEWYARAADQGDVNAMLRAAALVQTEGAGEPEEAAAMYGRAAELGDATGAFHLGLCHADGEGVPKDEARALALYLEAAAQGHADAMATAANAYEHGKGTEKDLRQAAEWYQKAAAKGFARAQYNLGWMLEKGQGVAADRARAVQLYRDAAAQGHAAADRRLKRLRAADDGPEYDRERRFEADDE